MATSMSDCEKASDLVGINKFGEFPFSHQRACYTSFAYTSVNAGKSSSHSRDILSKYRKIVPRKFGLKYILNIVLKNKTLL